MNFNKFTIKAQEAVQAGIELAQNSNNQAVEPAHILTALLDDADNVVNSILKKIGIALPALREDLQRQIKSFPVRKGIIRFWAVFVQ